MPATATPFRSPIHAALRGHAVIPSLNLPRSANDDIVAAIGMRASSATARARTSRAHSRAGAEADVRETGARPASQQRLRVFGGRS